MQAGQVFHKLLTCAVGALPCPWLLEPGAGPGVVPRGSVRGPLPRPRGGPWAAYRQGGDAASNEPRMHCLHLLAGRHYLLDALLRWPLGQRVSWQGSLLHNVSSYKALLTLTAACGMSLAGQADSCTPWACYRIP